MRTSHVLAALAVVPMLLVPAHAGDARMSGTQFVRAAGCLAYADLPALQSDRPDVGGLRAQVAAQIARDSDLQSRANAQTARAQYYADGAKSEAGLERLRARRD